MNEPRMNDHDCERLSAWITEGEGLALQTFNAVMRAFARDRRHFHEVIGQITSIGASGSFDLSLFQGADKVLVADLALLTGLKVLSAVHAYALRIAETGGQPGPEVINAIRADFGFPADTRFNSAGQSQMPG